VTLHFEPLSLDRQDEYTQLLAQCGQKASDYSFVNLWGWAEEYGLQWAFWNDLAVLRQTRPEVLYWAPVGDWSRVDWKVFQTMIPESQCFIRVPEQLKDIWVEQLFGVAVRECRDHWDYLYSVRELVELKGKRFHKKKNLLNQFLKQVEYEFIPLDEETIEGALALQTEWFLWRHRESDMTLQAENRAIVKVMHDWRKLSGLFGAGLAVGGRMIAYTIAERLDRETVVIHFEKGCPNYKGVYQAMNQLFLAISCQEYDLVNREQDLGDPGLRKSKESYNPVDHLQKFEICLG